MKFSEDSGMQWVLSSVGNLAINELQWELRRHSAWAVGLVWDFWTLGDLLFCWWKV